VRELPFIEAVYLEIDAELERQRTIAEDAGDSPASQRAESKKRINDQAFFLLCWGELETAIGDTCRTAIRRRRANANWAVRRGWDLYDPDHDRLSGLRFEHRAALVLDRQAGAGSPWATVMRYYGLRNQIAHGKLVVERIYVDEVVQDLFRIHALLQS
jgi:hypothetical protein